MKNENGRLMRYSLILSEFDFDIEHKPGLANGAADGLSRLWSPAAEVVLPPGYTVPNAIVTREVLLPAPHDREVIAAIVCSATSPEETIQRTTSQLVDTLVSCRARLRTGIHRVIPTLVMSRNPVDPSEEEERQPLSQYFKLDACIAMVDTEETLRPSTLERTVIQREQRNDSTLQPIMEYARTGQWPPETPTQFLILEDANFSFSPDGIFGTHNGIEVTDA